MKYLGAIILTCCTLRATAQGVDPIEFSLSGYASIIPSCAYADFAAAAVKAGCSTTNIDASEFACMCNPTGGVIADPDTYAGMSNECANGM
jgi:hypothetical protein